MPIYPDKINAIARESANARKLDRTDATAVAASFECGSFVRFELAETEGEIELAYRTNGCGFMIAVAETIAEHLKSKPLSELHGLADTELTAVVEQSVDQTYPNERQQCLRVVLEGVHGVFANLRETRLAASSEAIICTCFTVTEDTIENAIANGNLSTVEAVTDATRAGGGCGSCRMMIQEMVDAGRMI